jgi:Tol biopolymer transport system component
MRARSSLLVVGAVALLPLVACEPTDPAVERISETESGSAANGRSYAPTISDDGRYVAFVSKAGNIGGDPSDDDVADVFLHDRETGVTEAVTASGNSHSGYAPFCAADPRRCLDGPDHPEAPAISDDGSIVAFSSSATNR